MNLRNISLTVIKLASMILCCVILFGGHNPPSFAQSRHQGDQYPVVPWLSNEDVGQDHDISALNKHIEATDLALLKQRELLDANTNELSSIRGEERMFGGILAFLTGLGITLQVVVAKKKEA